MEQGTKRRILVIVGSDSDMVQCHAGLMALMEGVRDELVEMVRDGVLTMSVHRNHEQLVQLLRELHDNDEKLVIIAGAGWAAHLPGMIDAILNYELKNDRIVVIGVGFEDKENSRHTLAAELSISEVPGTRVLYKDAIGHFVGPMGFYRACIYAVRGELPEIKISSGRDWRPRSLPEAIVFAQEVFIKQQKGG